jgi:hypothetical protein
MRVCALTRTAALAVVLAGVACDGTERDVDAGADFAMPADMRLPGRGCGFIYNCLQTQTLAQCSANSPSDSVQLLQSVFACSKDLCGAVDGGQSCITNTLAGTSPDGHPTFFVDSMNNLPLACDPANAPECGKCIDVAAMCLFNDCYSDVDCAGVIKPDGTPRTCSVQSGDMPGTCE